MAEDRLMEQTAPYPEVLEELVGQLEYRPGWRFSLEAIDRGQGSSGLTLAVWGRYPNSYRPEEIISVVHYFPVPPAAYDRGSWQRWIFERLLEVERHEAMEFFAVAGVRPYAPNHGPGHDPYVTRELATDEDRRTSFRGEVKED